MSSAICCHLSYYYSRFDELLLFHLKEKNLIKLFYFSLFCIKTHEQIFFGLAIPEVFVAAHVVVVVAAAVVVVVVVAADGG